MTLNIDRSLKTRFPDLRVLTYRIRGVKVERRSADLERFGKEATI